MAAIRGLTFAVAKWNAIFPLLLGGCLPAAAQAPPEQVIHVNVNLVQAAVREGLGIYERFTRDRRQIEAGLERLLRRAGQSDLLINQAVEHKLASAMNAFFMETYHALTVAALSRAVEGLRHMPGGKGSCCFPMAWSSHPPFDARGLLPESPAALQEMPNLLARATGGIFAKNTNGLSDAVGKAMEDMTGYYLLAYQPSAGEFEEVNKHSGNHRIQVKLNRPGLNVRSRQSFSFLKEAPEAEPSTREDYLRRICPPRSTPAAASDPAGFHPHRRS